MRPPVLLAALIHEAIRALLRHKLRSALSTAGITIGIGAVILVIAIGRAASARVQAELQALGDNFIWIEAGSRNVAGVRTGSHGTTSLTVEDAEAIRREIPLIRLVSPQVDGNVQAISRNRNWGTRWRGETPEYLEIKRWVVASGRAFTQAEVDEAANKVLIGQAVRQQLFDDADPVGELIRLKGQVFEVVGVLAPKGQSADGRDQDDWILLPYTTAQQRFGGKGATWLDDILCSAVSAEAVEPAIQRLVALMRQRHHIGPGEEDDFNVRRPDEILKANVEAKHTLGLLLVSIALVSLVVGGVGIMNVMLASVVQRTNEIGIRLAVGATEWTIRMQFLAEAVALALVGGLFGVSLALAGALALKLALGWDVTIPLSALLLAVGSATAVGVLFGLYPAWRASRLNPIEALRFE